MKDNNSKRTPEEAQLENVSGGYVTSYNDEKTGKKRLGIFDNKTKELKASYDLASTSGHHIFQAISQADAKYNEDK